MDELATWLRAQLDEDERDLRAGLAEHRGSSPENVFRFRLTEMDTKQRLLDWAICWLDRDVAPWNADCIRLLALPYADRPGYREEWRL